MFNTITLRQLIGGLQTSMQSKVTGLVTQSAFLGVSMTYQWEHEMDKKLTKHMEIKRSAVQGY
jgi:hypothetical protein